MIFNFKLVAIVFLIIITGVLVFFFAKAGYGNYVWSRKTSAFTKALQKPFAEDDYGGKTPEETWAMFLDALQKKNIDLASKYFFFYDREFQFNRLNESIDKGTYDYSLILLSQNSLIKDFVDAETAQYHIDYLSKDGFKKNQSVTFTLNKYTKLWKLDKI